jgi:hypothetical protein
MTSRNRAVSIVTLFVVVAMFTTIQAISQTEEARRPAMPPPSHELSVISQTDLNTPQNPIIELRGKSPIEFSAISPNLFEIDGSSGYVFPDALPVTCKTSCYFKMKTEFTYGGIPKNNTIAVGIVVADSTGNSIGIIPFDSVGIFSTTVNGNGGTSTGSFAFFTAPLKAGTYYVDYDIFMVNDVLGKTPGITTSASQSLTVEAYVAF